jgi:hypothetical protein
MLFHARLVFFGCKRCYASRRRCCRWVILLGKTKSLLMKFTLIDILRMHGRVDPEVLQPILMLHTSISLKENLTWRQCPRASILTFLVTIRTGFGAATASGSTDGTSSSPASFNPNSSKSSHGTIMASRII